MHNVDSDRDADADDAQRKEDERKKYYLVREENRFL